MVDSLNPQLNATPAREFGVLLDADVERPSVRDFAERGGEDVGGEGMEFSCCVYTPEAPRRLTGRGTRACS